MKRVGELYGVPVMSSPFVEKDSIYLINPGAMYVFDGQSAFKPYKTKQKIKWYLKNLWKAIRGKAV